MKTILSYLVVSLLLCAGCDSSQEDPERQYEVTYRTSSTFETCNITYANQSGGINQLADEPLAGNEWSLVFTVTVREFSSFLAQLSVVCLQFDLPAQTLTGSILIDGTPFESANESGITVSFDLDARLTLEGPEHVPGMR